MIFSIQTYLNLVKSKKYEYHIMEITPQYGNGHSN